MTDPLKTSRGRPLEPEEKDLIRAETERITAERLMLEAQTQQALDVADMVRWDKEHKKREVDTILARDFYHYIYRFNGEVEEKNVTDLTHTLSQWDRRSEEGEPFTVIFNSPGGGVVQGMALYDELRQQSRRHPITTIARGHASSMGGILMQAGDTRIVGREAWVLIHEVSGILHGSFGDMEDRMEWLKRQQDRILDIFAERSNGKRSRRQFERAWKRADFWLDAEDCISWGVADEIQ